MAASKDSTEESATPELVALGQRIRKLREAKGWSQPDLSYRVEFDQGAISAYENGSREPQALRLAKMAQAFGVTTDELLGLEPPESARLEDPYANRKTLRTWASFQRLPKVIQDEIAGMHFKTGDLPSVWDWCREVDNALRRRAQGQPVVPSEAEDRPPRKGKR